MRRSNGPDTSPIPARGRPFPRGNPGRRPGSKNRSTLLVAALLEGETEALLRKAIQLARAGNVPMLKLPAKPHNASRPSGQTRSAANGFRR